ncbi:MAG: tetratricopeptide repeat protein, partial [Asticcacaulis sp.]
MQKSVAPLLSALILSLSGLSPQAFAQASGLISAKPPTTDQEWIREGFHFYDKKDFVMAAAAFEKAAEKGNVRAQTILGALYVTGGNGLAVDYRKAVSWLRKAADAGSADAQSLLAALHNEGNGVARDPHKARQLYTQAAAGGNKAAIQWLEKNPLPAQAPASAKTPQQLHDDGEKLHQAGKFAEALP